MIFKVHTQYKWIVRAKFWILCPKVGSRGKIFPTVNCLHTYIEDVFAVLGINLIINIELRQQPVPAYVPSWKCKGSSQVTRCCFSIDAALHNLLLTQGPSINNVGNFYGFLTPPSPMLAVFRLSIGNFDQYLTPPHPNCRRQSWMAPQHKEAFNAFLTTKSKDQSFDLGQASRYESL